MPKYSGIVDLKGTFGNYSFYKRKGVGCVRRPGGFSKERLASDPALHRVVEHNSEFGAQSMASKSLRTALAPLKKFWDGTFHNRLMKIASRVTALTEGIHGQRPVAFSRVKPILHGLQLNKGKRFEASLLTNIKSIPSSARNSTRLQLDFDIPTAVTEPKGATHFRLAHALAVASDIEYEPALGGFIPAAYQVDGLSAVSQSDHILLEQKEPANFTFETTLRTDNVPENATVVEVVGIEFFQALGNVFEPMAQGRAAMIVGVF